jgi:hypothetical protein
MHKLLRQHALSIFILFLLFSGAVFMRFYNLNWDEGNLFHPDERNIASAVTKILFFSQLNPQFFAYGGFSIYLYRFAANVLVFFTHDQRWIMNWGSINLIGRFFSALFASVTLIPLYFLAKNVFNRQTAILSSIFYAFCVSAIQLAHFATTDSLLTGEGVLMGLLGVSLYHQFSWKKVLSTGFIFGISVATKTTAISLLLFPLLGIGLAVFPKRISLGKALFSFAILLLISAIFFTLFSPYTILDYKDFLSSMRYESGVATGSLPVVYTYQFNGSIPYLFQLYNFFWQIGFLVPCGILGVFLTMYLFYRTQHMKYVIFLIFPLFYFFYVGSWHTKFIRYMLPFLPFFVIYASAFLVWLQKYNKVLSYVLIGFLFTTNLCWAIAFFTIYTRPQTRIVASEWIYAHIPAGSRLLTEQWDDGLPITVGMNTAAVYSSLGLAMYDSDTQTKRFYLAQSLANNDYLIFNSRRLYGTLIHLTKQYPLTSTYYKDLFNNSLGYKQIATFTSYPILLGLTFPDDITEETFQVYDHPKVIIFKNSKHYATKQLYDILGAQ